MLDEILETNEGGAKSLTNLRRGLSVKPNEPLSRSVFHPEQVKDTANFVIERHIIGFEGPEDALKMFHRQIFG
jgi:hypothetical protein